MRRRRKMTKMSRFLKKLGCFGLAKSLSWEEQQHPPPPKGHVRVYVGKEVHRKFELEADYLNHPLFEDLLRLSVDEFGYSHPGALRMFCGVPLFLHLVQLLKCSDPSAYYLQLQDLLPHFYDGKHPPLPAQTPN